MESTAGQLTPSEVVVPPRPVPLGSTLVASAKRITNKTVVRVGTTARSWSEDAWDMYDLVGEQRFLATTLAGRMSQARLYVGRMGEDPTEAPERVEDRPAVTDVLDAMGGSPSGRAQMIARLGINLFLAGDGWLAGIPSALMPGAPRPPTGVPVVEPVPDPSAPPLALPLGVDIADLEWRMLSVSEVSSNNRAELTLKLGETVEDHITCRPEDILLIRVWRSHPRRAWEADSPTRASLPVLRELVGLTMHVSAQVDSRLAGAGLLIVPASAKRALMVAAGMSEDDNGDPFTEALMEAMLTPIGDRSNASALVPLVVTVPDDVTDKFNYLTFAKPLDSEARVLRDEAIRRLALGQDAPPELLLGTAGMNHWGAWLVREDVVTTHLEPPLALICDALTTEYLWPILIQQGMDEETAHGYVVWYDVSDLITRPNRSQDAMVLHEKGVISDSTLRTAAGFDDIDAPESERLDPIIAMALDLVRANPSLVSAPGIPAVVAQLREVLGGAAPSAAPPPDDDGTPEGVPVPDGSMPATDQAPAELPPVEASSANGTALFGGREAGTDV